MLVCIGRYTNNRQAKVPCADIALLPTTYFEAKYLLEDVVLREPSHLRLSDISKLWTHWVQHQENWMVGLAFIWCDPKDLHEAYSRRKGKGKGKAYKEIDDDDEEEEGEDLEQAQRGAGPSSRKGRKRRFSSGWVDREEVDEELMESQISPSPPLSLSLPPPPPHASSPANMPWKNRPQRFAFLCALSAEPKYQALVNTLDNCIVCAPFIYLMANKSNLNSYILEG